MEQMLWYLKNILGVFKQVILFRLAWLIIEKFRVHNKYIKNHFIVMGRN